MGDAMSFKKALKASAFLLLFLVFNMGCHVSKAQVPDIFSEYFPRVEAENWMRAQSDASLPEESKIKATVDTYFKLKCASLVDKKAYDFSFLFDSGEEAQKNAQYEKNLIRLMMANWGLLGTGIVSYEYMPKYYKITIRKHRADVSMWPSTNIIHADTPERMDSMPWTLNFLSLFQRDGCWYVFTDTTDDEWHLLNPPNTDFANKILSLPEEFRLFQKNDKALAEKLKADPRTSWRFEDKRTQSAFLPLGYRRFDKYLCSYYANIWSSNEPGAGSYNPLFIVARDLSGNEADCQNFVSQCLWYGYGGINESGPIENHDLPMIDDNVPARTWWCNSSGTGTYLNNYCWTSVASFHWMATKNYSENTVGLRTTRGTISATLVGDYIKFRTISHVYIISRIVDYNMNNMTDFNEIYICSHTTNHRDRRLSDLLSYPPPIYYMWNMGFLDPESQ